MKTYKGLLNIIELLSKRYYTETFKPSKDDLTIMYFAPDTQYKEDSSIDFYFFHCPVECQTWLEQQSEFVDLIDITNELIIE